MYLTLYLCNNNRRYGINLSKEEIKKSISVSNLPDYVAYLVGIYGGVYRKRNLTDRESKFLVCLVLYSLEGYDKYTGSRLKLICKSLEAIKRDSDLPGLMKSLKEKDWIDYDKKTKVFEIDEFFKNINKEQHLVEIDIAVTYENFRENN